MELKRILPYYNITVGISIIIFWIIYIIMGEIPEFENEFYSITYHIIAETITAIMLIISGFGLIQKKDNAGSLFFVSQGMLFYAVINSAGYYVDQGEIGFVLMFSILTIISPLVIILKIKNQ